MKAAPAVIATLALLFVVQTCRQEDSEAAAREEWHRADNAEARASKTERMNANAQKAIALMGVVGAGYQRHAVQESQRADRLDKALGLERRANIALTVTVPKVSTTVPVSGTTEAEDVRRGKFHVVKAPYTVTGTVELPRPPGDGKLGLDISLDPLRMNLRLGCGRKGSLGLRSATASVVASPWATVSLDTVSQTREVCNPPKKKRLLRDAVMVGLGVLVRSLVPN